MIYQQAELHNVEEMLATDDGRGQWLSRVPNSLRLKLSPFAQYMALFGSGCEIRFNLRGDQARIVLMHDLFPAYAGAGVYEVYFGSFSASYVYGPAVIRTEPTEIVIKKPARADLLRNWTHEHAMPFDPELVRIVLPYDTQNRLLELEGDLAVPETGQTPATKYLCYGSSITQGASALYPLGTYPARTAHHLGMDLINLGSAGSAFLEGDVADYIARRTDWQVASLELGANVVGWMTLEEFTSRVDYFISTIAEAHPDQWIFCIDIFPFHAPVASEEKVQAFREVVRQKVESLNRPKLVHVRGQDFLKAADAFSFDLVHPSQAGMDAIAIRLSELIRNYTEEAAR